MRVEVRPARFLVRLGLAGALGLAGCTAYQPVEPRPGQSWAEARAEAQRAAERVAAERRLHRVQRGESVARLAQRYDVPAGEIVAANRLRDPDKLLVGQTLVIPAKAAPPAGSQPTGGPLEGTIGAAGTVRVTALPPPDGSPGPSTTPHPSAPVTGERTTPRPRVEPDPEALRRAQEVPPPPLSGAGFLQPVTGKLVSGFGDKGDGRRNDGINLAAPRGTPVRAAENGVVVYAGESIPGFGLLLLIRHADGFTTTYAHLDEVLVAVGERVERGQVVARVGDSGDVKTAQLHFQLRRGAAAVDPRPHLAAPPVQLASRATARTPGG